MKNYCILFHKWTKWSEEKIRPMRVLQPSGSIHGYEQRYQTRICLTCNALQYRNIPGTGIEPF